MSTFPYRFEHLNAMLYFLHSTWILCSSGSRNACIMLLTYNYAWLMQLSHGFRSWSQIDWRCGLRRKQGRKAAHRPGWRLVLAPIRAVFDDVRISKETRRRFAAAAAKINHVEIASRPQDQSICISASMRLFHSAAVDAALQTTDAAWLMDI